jgi:hypothetical protein
MWAGALHLVANLGQRRLLIPKYLLPGGGEFLFPDLGYDRRELPQDLLPGPSIILGING